jgi:hypothetical protein
MTAQATGKIRERGESMTTTRIYYSPIFGVFTLFESETWFSELVEEIDVRSGEHYWHYIGDL